MLKINQLQVTSRLSPISFSLEKGKILHVLGANGSGKSTLLSAISGLMDYQGTVELSGNNLKHTDLKSLAQTRAYLTQSHKPIFNMKVYQYLSLFIHNKPWNKKIEQEIQPLTHTLSIEDKFHCAIHHLSGGEWQRVRIAGACLQIWPTFNPKAELLLLDEPAAALDIGQETLLYRMLNMLAEQGITIIMANHDLNRSLHHSDYVLCLKHGKPEAYGATSDIMTSSLLSHVFDAQIVKMDSDNTAYLRVMS